jgi:hypothetical protein
VRVYVCVVSACVETLGGQQEGKEGGAIAAAGACKQHPPTRCPARSRRRARRACHGGSGRSWRLQVGGGSGFEREADSSQVRPGGVLCWRLVANTARQPARMCQRWARAAPT